MKATTWLGTCITVLLGTVLLGSAMPGLAQEVPNRLEPGMPYAEARQILLAAGWQTVVVDPTTRPSDSVETQTMVDRGYSEVVDCADTGAGFCRFEFANSAGETLAVITGRDEHLEPILYRWSIESE